MLNKMSNSFSFFPQPQIYSNVVVEMDVDVLAVTTLLLSPQVFDVEGTSFSAAFDVTQTLRYISFYRIEPGLKLCFLIAVFLQF